ncbi:serine-rich adhesin for platelets-like [Sceloporus undulatus]|uniref:serine-rich adhesin for platelets-like n=1 Tax=Sceloporus undulatus TaxID=8520 RepID=UPI001C4AC2D8|nr:serine-rich adhesin for platelets-like [Sceloporus undulatus]
MGTQKEMFWTFLGFWACLLCEPGLTAAIPVDPTEADDFTDTDYLSWGTSTDYFDPTVPTTTEETFTIQSTVPFIADGGTPEENPGASKEENPSSPAEEETQESVLASNVDSPTKAPNQVEITPPREEMEAATEVQVNEKEGLAKGNSSNTSSEKGTIQTTPTASEQAAASPVLGSAEVPSTFSNEQPETGVTDSSLAPAPTAWEKTDDIGLNDAPSSGQEKTLDSTTGETNADSEQKPTLGEDATDDVAEPEGETPQNFPDASSETVSIPGAPSSNTEDLPVAEPGVTPANDGHLVPSASGDDIEGEEPTPATGLSPPDLLPPSNTPSESSELSEPATASIQPSPSGKDSLGGEPAIAEGRGDSDSSVSDTVPDHDAEPTITPSLEDPDLSPESSADGIPAESEDFVGAEVSNTPPADDTTNFLPGIASSSGAPSRPSDLGSDATVGSPLGLPMPPVYSSLLPEDDEIQTVSVTKEESEEGSGTASSNETPFTLASPEQEKETEVPEGAFSATESSKGNVSADMESGTASPLKPGEKLAENGQPGAAIQSEMIHSSSERTPLNSAGEAGGEPEGLFDMDETSPSSLENETEAKDQGMAGETAFPPSQSGTSTERQEGDSLSSAPGSLSEGNMMVPELGVASGSVTSEEGESRTDFPPSDTELAPADGTQLPIRGSELLMNGESSSPSPLEMTVVPESDTAEAPSNSLPGSLGSSQSDDNMQADEEATEGSKEPEDTNANAMPTTDTGSATEGAKFPGSNEEDLPSGGEIAGAASESEINNGTISENNNNLDEINTLPSEPGTDAEEGMVVNTGSVAEITDDGSGDFSPFPAGSGTSTKAGELSEERSSSTLLDATSSETFTSEAEEGKDFTSPPFGDFSSSPSGTEAPGGTKDGDGSTGLLTNEESMTTSGEIQTGTDISDAEPGSSEGAKLPLGQSGSLPGGEISGQPLLEEGETSITATSSGEEFPSTSASSATDGETSAISVSAEDSPSGSGKNSSPFLVSKSSGVQPSGPSETPDSYQPSSDDALKSESAIESSAGSERESQELGDTSSVAEKGASLDPSGIESLAVSPSTERLGSVGSSLEDGEEPQLSPDDTASDGAEQSEGEGKMSMAPSATMSQPASDGVEANGLEVAGNEGSQLSPDSTPKMGSESISGAEKEPEDISVVSGMKSSSAEGVETSFSGAAMGSQPFTDGSTKVGTVADLGAFDEMEKWEGSSPVNEEKTPPGSSSTESLGTSEYEDVSGGLGKERPFLSAEGIEAATSESEASKGSQPSLNGATAGAGDSDGIKIPEGSFSMSGEEASLAPLAIESHSAAPSAEGVETASAGSANEGGSQPSLDGGEADHPGMSSSVSAEGASSAPSATEAQPGFSFSGGFNNDGLSTSGSPTSPGEGSQMPPDYASGAGSEAGEESGNVSDMSGKKSSLTLSNEGEEMSVSGLGSDVGSQPSPDDAEAAAAGPRVSEEAKQGGSSSAAVEEEAPLGTSAIGSKSPGAFPGEGPANNAASQTYGAASAGAVASEKEEESEDSSTTNGKKLPLSSSDTESKSPGTSASEEISRGLGEEESSLPSAGLDSTGTQTTSSSETGLSPENIAEQLGEKSGPMNTGEPSTQSSPADDGSVVAVINKGSGETLLSGSISPDGTVNLQGTPGQASGITDSSLPPSEFGGVGGNFASPGSAENSVLTMSGQPALSYSNTLGDAGSTSPMAKEDAEDLAGILGSGTVTSNSIGASLQSSGSGGTKVAIDQQSGLPLSPSTSSSSSENQPFGFYESGIESPGNAPGEASSQSQAVEAKETGKVDSFPSGASPNGLASSPNEASVGDMKGLSPTTSEGRGDTDSSVLTADKGTSTLSGEAHPSLSGTSLCPATTPQLPAVESGSEVNAGVSPQSSKAEVTENVGHTLSGKPSASVLVSSSSTASGSEATKSGSMTSTSISSLPDSSVQSEAGATVGKDTSGGAKASSTSGKPDASLAASGVGLEAVKPSQTASKTSDEEEDVKISDKKEDSKKSEKKEDSKKSGKKDDSKKSDKKEDSDKEDSKKESKTPSTIPPCCVHGLWIYKLDSRVRLNYRQRCLDWLSNERQPAVWNKDLPSCPCSLQQGLSDYRFIRSRRGLLDSSFTMLYTSLPNKYGAGVRCLYKNPKGQLVDGHQERIWKGSRRNFPFNDEELKLYNWCCYQAGKQQFCDKYHQKRPKIGCDGYSLPVRATSSEEKLNSNERD